MNFIETGESKVTLEMQPTYSDRNAAHMLHDAEPVRFLTKNYLKL